MLFGPRGTIYFNVNFEFYTIIGKQQLYHFNFYTYGSAAINQLINRVKIEHISFALNKVAMNLDGFKLIVCGSFVTEWSRWNNYVSAAINQ